MSRPRQTLAETRAVARALALLAQKIEAQTIAIEQLRAGQPSQLGRIEDALRFDLATLTTASEARGL
jgi:hypothetical protein